MKTKEIKIRITTTQELLGMSPGDSEIYQSYIASKAPDALDVTDEIEATSTDEVFDRKCTVFPKQNGKPGLWDYQIKGFFKDACGMLQRCAGKDENGKRIKGGNLSSKLTAYKKVIDGTIFVAPRFIPINYKGGMLITERPLRADTMQGPRVALAASETIPAGAVIEFKVVLLNADDEGLIREWLDYGSFRGLGQWRNGGFGRFEWQEIK